MQKGKLEFAVVAAVTLGLVAPALASGATRYAEPGGSGPEPCVQGDPCDLTTAVEGAAAVDKVRLAPGDYSVTVVVDIPNGTDVGGVPGQARPVVTGTAFYVFDMDGADSRLHDIEVRTDTLYGVFAAGTLERARVRATTGGTACVAAFGLIRDTLCTNADAGGVALGIASVCGGPTVHSEAKAVNVTAVSTNGPGVTAQASGGCDLAVVGTNVIASGSPTDVTVGADLSAGSRAEVALSYSIFDSTASPGPNDFVTIPVRDRTSRPAPRSSMPPRATTDRPRLRHRETRAPRLWTWATSTWTSSPGSPRVRPTSARTSTSRPRP